MMTAFFKFLKSVLTTRSERPKSSLGYEYPTLRDHPLHTPEIWLRGKQEDDGAEGLWRFYDGLYDLTTFVDKHPGGADWLEMTKGTDITEAFEAHHISTKPETLLQNYYVRKAKSSRNSPFTFEENGFYKTLKRQVRKELEYVPSQPEKKTKILTDSLIFLAITLSLMAVKEQSYVAGLLSAAFLTMTAVAAHNFFHQKDNFRMYYFDFTMMSSRGWRVSHVLSHHIYTNTIYDLEISSLEPFLQHLPCKKNFIVRYISWLYSPIFYCFIYFGYYIKNIIQAITEKKLLRLENYIPCIHLYFLYIFGGQSFARTTTCYLGIQIVSSFLFGLIGINAAHHHPDIFHDGDQPRTYPKIDWGLHQMDSVMDKLEVTGSHFLVLISFGDHALHHLFPTLDHGRLNYLYPVLKDVCDQFGITIKMTSQLDLLCGQFRTLAKTEPKKIPAA